MGYFGEGPADSCLKPVLLCERNKTTKKTLNLKNAEDKLSKCQLTKEEVFIVLGVVTTIFHLYLSTNVKIDWTSTEVNGSFKSG